MFEPQLSAFDERYNLLLWDARGHALSRLAPNKRFNFEDMLDDFFKLCKLYQISNAILIAQSMGGNLAQEILYRKPEMVSKLILIDCTKNTDRLTPTEKLTLKLTKPIFYCYPWKTLIRQRRCVRQHGSSKAICSGLFCPNEEVRFH
jgi:pimeloyl-ACP methyl ester carboxylesterase